MAPTFFDDARQVVAQDPRRLDREEKTRLGRDEGKNPRRPEALHREATSQRPLIMP